VTVIVAEYRDRFARFGAGYAEAALPAPGRRLLLVGTAGAGGGLVRGVTGVLASVCARQPGWRAAAGRAAWAVVTLSQDGPG
jgi:predicted site-specific integrase-resolvase